MFRGCLSLSSFHTASTIHCRSIAPQLGNIPESRRSAMGRKSGLTATAPIADAQRAAYDGREETFDACPRLDAVDADRLAAAGVPGFELHLLAAGFEVGRASS
jgi:hypothetical protein